MNRQENESGGDTSIDLPVLPTKLFPPKIPANFLHRTSILDKFEDGWNHSLTLVSAPAGYGKSLSVSAWIEHSDHPSFWLSLDESDNDLRTFLTYLTYSMRKVVPLASAAIARLLKTPEIRQGDSLIIILIQEIAKLKKPICVILDDYHLIHNRQIHDIVSALLLHSLDTLRLVILTRHDPPLPLALLRSRDQVTEIDVESLRFTDRESEEYLSRQLSGEKDPSSAIAINRQLEGWPAGLRLVTLSSENWKDLGNAIQKAGMGFRQVSEYFLIEVLNRQPAEIADYLLEASILERFNAQLCDWKRDTPGKKREYRGCEFIEWIERENVFAVNLDTEGYWLRFHHLFRKLLHDELIRTRTEDEIIVLHRRASDWFAENEYVEEAIHHAIQAKDSRLVSKIVKRYRYRELGHDKWYVVQQWLLIIPSEMLLSQIQLLVASCWVAKFRFRLELIEPLLKSIDSLLGEEDVDSTTSAEIDFFRAVDAYHRGEIKTCFKLCAKALTLFSEPRHIFGGQLRIYYSMAMHGLGETEQSLAYLDDESKSGAVDDAFFQTRLSAAKMFVHYVSGDLRPVARECERLRIPALRNDFLYASVWADFFEGVAHFHSWELDAARNCLQLSLRNIDFAERRLAIDNQLLLALTYEFLGSESLATQIVDKMVLNAKVSKESDAIAFAESARARLWVLNGNLESAIKWARETYCRPTSVDMILWSHDLSMAKVMVHIAEGSSSSLIESLDTLDILKTGIKELNLICQLIDVLACQCVAEYKLDRIADAKKTFSELLPIAESGGWIRPFVERGRPMANLLVDIRSSTDDCSTFMVELVNLCTEYWDTVEQSPRARAGASLIEKLTKGELAVLPLLAGGLTNKQIAAQLHVSPETVKKRLSGVYQKLDASNRTSAVAKSREHGLLHPE